MAKKAKGKGGVGETEQIRKLTRGLMDVLPWLVGLRSLHPELREDPSPSGTPWSRTAETRGHSPYKLHFPSQAKLAGCISVPDNN